MPGTEHPKIVGDRTQLAVMIALYTAGYDLYVPFGENTRCDLVIERAGQLDRVQIKTGRLRRGAVEFKVCSSYAHHPNPKTLKRTYEGDAEVFGVHCRETGGVYLVPVRDLSLSRLATLRVDHPRNNQRERIRWAEDYEVGSVVIGGLRVPSGA